MSAAKISFYNSAKDVSPSKEITIGELVEMIHDEVTAGGVERVRNSATEDEKRVAKMKLPAVQLSGQVTEGNRKQAMQEGRFVHSGFLQLDVDDGGLNGKTPEDARLILGGDRHVISAFVSPSGEGAKALFKIKPCLTDEEHKQAFRHVEKYIFESYGLKIDPSTKDSGRLCFIPSDRECTWNGATVEFVPPAPSAEVIAPAAAGLVIRGGQGEREDWTLEDLAEMIAPIQRPAYDDWLAICSGAWNHFGEAASSVLSARWPEETEGEYERKFRNKTADHSMGTVVHFAKANGWTPSVKNKAGIIPENVFPVPAGGISYTEASMVIFSHLGTARRLFTRGGVAHEIRTSASDPDCLSPVTPERFCSLVEKCNHRVCRREKNPKDGKFVWRKTGFPISSAKIMLETDEARNNLPPIVQISAAAILTKAGQVLGRGYHDHGGGVLVTAKTLPVEMPFESARASLLGLLDDFRFTSPSDLSRAVASFISPALKAGGHIADDFPIDVAEADQSQSGKTFRQKLVCKIYDEIPAAIIQSRGGVGSLDEALATALITGRPFIAMDNFRGKLDSTLLEEATRGHEVVTCRALRRSVEVRTRPFNFQLSLNDGEFTRDVANRSIITRIRKQPPGFIYRQYKEGRLGDHVEANQNYYLGAVFACIREWQRLGRPTTADTRHSFRGWSQALDGIIQHVMRLEPLLDGHSAQQDRVANPNLQWLRAILLSAKSGDIGIEINTGQFLRIAEDAGIDFPGNPNSKDDPAIRAGRILGKLFRDSEGHPVIVDGFLFSRNEGADYSGNGSGQIRKFYTIQKA